MKLIYVQGWKIFGTSHVLLLWCCIVKFGICRHGMGSWDIDKVDVKRSHSRIILVGTIVWECRTKASFLFNSTVSTWTFNDISEEYFGKSGLCGADKCKGEGHMTCGMVDNLSWSQELDFVEESWQQDGWGHWCNVLPTQFLVGCACHEGQDPWCTFGWEWVSKKFKSLQGGRPWKWDSCLVTFGTPLKAGEG